MVGFETRGARIDVLHGIDLEVVAGRTLGLVGESGCGKSVTMMAAMGLLGKRGTVSGSIRIDGEELVGKSEPEWRKSADAALR